MATALRGLIGDFPASGYVSVLQGLDIVNLRVIHSSYPLRFVLHQGTTLPAFITAMGKSLLARLPAEDLASLLPRQLKYEPFRITRSRADLLAELDEVRIRGWAELEDPTYRAAGAIAITIKPPSQEAVAFGINYALAATAADARTEMIRRMIDAAEHIARTAGDTEWLKLVSRGL